MPDLKPISLNELPKYSPWIKKIVGLESFESINRTEAKNYKEYDEDKFGFYLNYIKKHAGTSIEDIRYLEKNRQRTDTVCISKNGRLFLTNQEYALGAELDLIIRTLGPIIKKSDVVIDLGAGYGYHLSRLADTFPNHRYVGGDFSTNAITLAKRVARNKKISIMPFNFYDKRWEILECIKYSRALIFTFASIAQLPKAMPFFEGIRQYKDKILQVVHFEPIYELYDHGDMLLGLLRKKYTLLNDYNTDLLSTLKNADLEAEILDIKFDVWGHNPLLPLSMIQWRFR